VSCPISDSSSNNYANLCMEMDDSVGGGNIVYVKGFSVQW
jgi:hypothetical protein